MRVVVSSNGADLEGLASPTFGRCPMFLFVETDSMEFEAVPNPGVDAPGGAGIEAAQFVLSSGIGAVITGRVGPKAMNVLQAAGTPVFLTPGGTVRQAVEDFNAGKLSSGSGRPARGDAPPTELTPHRREPPPSPVERVEPGSRMRIAFSVDEDRGLESTVSHHFGRCPYYVLVDVQGGKPAGIQTVGNPYYGNHQPGEVPRFIHSQGAQVIVSGGMGRRALAFFQADQVEPVTGANGTVEQALQEFLSGRLTGAAPCRDSMQHDEGEHLHAAETAESNEPGEIDRLRDQVEALEQKLAQALNRKDGRR